MSLLRRLASLLLLALWSIAATAAAAPEANKPAPCPPGAETTPGAEEPESGGAQRLGHEAGQLLLYWPDAETAATELARLEKELGLHPAETIPLGTLGGVVALLRFDPGADLDALRRKLRLALRGASVDFNARYYYESGPRQYLQRQIKLSPEKAPGPLVPIGIVDGPVDAIPALRGVAITHKSFLATGATPSPPRHATAVASLAAGNDPDHGFSGSAAGAALYNAEVMRRDGGQDSTTTLMLVQAIDWLLAQKVRVINLSLGGNGDALMARTFERLGRWPVVVIAAAGNAGPDAPPRYPAAYPGVLAVTASNAAFESYAAAGRGPHIAIAAPGEAVWVPDREAGHYVSGTSFATALVSGAVARLLGAERDRDAAAVRGQLCRHALDLGLPGPDRVFGCGLLQVAPLISGTSWATLP
jgi:subtilisin family serine protease